jgi:hypothetical protein
MSLSSRLKAIEKATRLNTPVIDPEALARWNAAAAARETNWQIMASTMSQEHIAILQDVGRILDTDGEDAAKRHAGYHLFNACRDVLLREPFRQNQTQERLIPPQVALAMPPTLAENILRTGGAHLRLHDCADCGFRVPMPSDRTFDVCPLCGGELGWYAFFEKHRVVQ